MKYEVETITTHRESKMIEASSPEEAMKLVDEGKGEPRRKALRKETQAYRRPEPRETEVAAATEG